MKSHKSLIESAKLFNCVISKLIPEFKVFDKDCIVEALNKNFKKELIESYVSDLSNDELNILSESLINVTNIADSYIDLAKETIKINLESYKTLIAKKLTESNIRNSESVDALIDLAFLYESLSYAFDTKVAFKTSKAVFESYKHRKLNK